MKLTIIKLKVALTPNYLRTHIRKVLNKIELGQYISIHTKFMIDKNSFPTRSLGNKCYLNLENNVDKNLYLSYVTNLYRYKTLNGYKYKRITGLYIHCIKSNKKDYNNKKKTL